MTAATSHRTAGPAPVLVAALRLEVAALAGSAHGATLVRTGMGPRRAGAAATALAARRAVVGRHATATVVAGVGGGLVGDLPPGHLVVADRVIDADGAVVRTLPGAGILAGALVRAGLPTRVGAVVTSPVLVHTDRDRRRLARLGALVVDTESATVLAAIGEGPAAVVRAVADGPGHRLVSPATLARGWRALQALRSAAPVLCTWAGAAGPRTVSLAGPRSFCAGVERAVETVDAALVRFGAPVYVRRPIVHNDHVVADLARRGAVFVRELDEVPEGATVVLSAHGVAPRVRADAERRSLRVVDATCPLVAKVHREVRRFAEQGRHVVLVGHAGHDEVEGTLGEVPGIHLVQRPEDVATLDLDGRSSVAYATQTTLAPDDVAATVTALRGRFADLVGPSASDICYATHNRQQAVAAVAADADLTIVIGSTTSSNAHRLVEVATRAGGRAVLVDDETGIDPAWLTGTSRLAVTAAASTPESVVDRVLAALGGLGPLDVHRRDLRRETTVFPLPQEVR